MNRSLSDLPRERWWIEGPTDDETIHSIVERAWRCHGTEGHPLRRRVWPRATVPADEETGLDDLSPKEICLLARTIGMEPRELYGHRLSDHPMLLREDQRRVYCPLCWKEDARTGHPPSFRRAWMGVFTLSCPQHGVPLLWAPLLPTLAELRSAELRFIPATIRPRSPFDISGTFDSIDHFARVMEANLWRRAPWPARWRGSACAARALIMRCAVNLGVVPEHAPFSSIGYPEGLSSFVGVPIHRLDPLLSSPWEQVRSLGPPSWRRAVLWMVANCVMPESSKRRRPPRPPGLLNDPFAAIEAQWESQSPTRTFRRLRRYRSSLLPMSNSLILVRSTKPFDN